jgi:hypothetical protein
MSEWQSTVYLLTGDDGVCGGLGRRVIHERSIGPMIAPESQRRWVTALRLRQRIPPAVTVTDGRS